MKFVVVVKRTAHPGEWAPDLAWPATKYRRLYAVYNVIFFLVILLQYTMAVLIVFTISEQASNLRCISVTGEKMFSIYII